MDLGFQLDPGEEVIKIVRRHIIDVVPSVLEGAFLVCFATGLAYLIGRYPTAIPFSAVIVGIIVLLTLIIGASILLVGIYAYRHNYMVFTNIHLVEVEQTGLFGKRVSQLSFVNVEDVSGARAGLLATILNYGDVTVQSAGEQEKFIFHNCPDPQGIADEALQHHENCVRAREERLGAPAAVSEP